MKKVISYVLISMCCFMLCGCTEYPSMSDADLDLVAEYAAGILLQNSSTAQNRLMDIEEALLILEEEAQQEQGKEEEPVEELEEEQEEIVEPDLSETPVKDLAENVEEDIPSAPINNALGVDSLDVEINGYEIKDSYADGIGAFIALDAKEGHKLFVTKIILTNNTDSAIEVNMLELSTSFKISLDGNGYKYVLSTMLPDDLSTYIGKLGVGEVTELVLISEWKEEELDNITNPTLHIKNGENAGFYSIQ